ncbi:MAG: dihydrodipicolinate synthase family protein [Planctomycetota bacterium]
MTHLLTGIIPAVPTPMTADGNLHLDVIPDLVDRLVADGASAAFVCGTTGESSSLTPEERRRVLEAYMTAVDGRIPVIAHVGGDCLRTGAELARHAEGLGVAAIAATPPHYFAAASTQTLLDCIAAITAGAPGTPYYHYHIPVLSGVAVKVAEVFAEAGDRIPTLAGVKYTDENLMDFRGCLTAAGGRYNCLGGRDEQLLGFLATGAHGAVGSTYTYAAPLFVRLCNAFRAGDLETAQQEQDRAIELVRVLVRYGGLVAGKAIAGMVGPEMGPPRLPNRGLDADAQAALRRDLEAIGFFDWGRTP